MTQIGLFFGTQTGNIQTTAKITQKKFGSSSVGTFQDAIRLLEAKIKKWGNTSVERCSTAIYDFTKSKAVKNGSTQREVRRVGMC